MAPAASRGDVTLNDALDAITGGTLKVRGTGLDDLIFLLDEKKAKTANLSILADKHYHRIFEALFRCAITEKQSYYSGKKTTAASAATRLSKCAEALRLALNHGASKLKRKTVLAVIDHITQTLPGPDNNSHEMVEPLLQNYIKAIVALLSHQANVEHLATFEGNVLSLRHLGLSRITHLAFSSLNVILTSTQSNDLVRTKALAADVAPLISHWWQGRTVSKDEMLNSVRDEMLKTIFAIHLHLERLLQDGEDLSIQGDVEDLFDTLWLEYTRRNEQSQLHIDDISFTITTPDDFFRLRSFGLRPHNQDGERKWAMLQVLAFLEKALWKAQAPRQSQHEIGTEELEQPRKKKRRVDAANDRLQGRLKSPSTGVRRATVSDEITSIVTTADVNGPAILVDSSMALMLQLILLRGVKLPNQNQSTSHHVIRWVFLRWKPADMAFASLHSAHHRLNS
ncbi:Serine/threonine-protein kinase TEL1 like [Verticillium longisporum]|nr:Serine/threonine-protein kinase TEL1 like [Verticillium longisporum]